MTIDQVNISDWLTGAVLDFRFDAYRIPDRFIVAYPQPGDVVIDTGWRGDPEYERDPLFPGGITGGGEGEELGFATKLEGQDTLYVTAIGPDMGTSWEYWMRCTPQ